LQSVRQVISFRLLALMIRLSILLGIIGHCIFLQQPKFPPRLVPNTALIVREGLFLLCLSLLRPNPEQKRSNAAPEKSSGSLGSCPG